MNSKTHLFNLLIIVILFLSSCNLPAKVDPEEQLSQTAVAETVAAFLSATPTGGTATPSFTPAPPTLTPVPAPVNTNTAAATATSNCNVAQFVADTTIPDGTLMTPGQAFTKKWRIKNIGSCAWNGFTLVFDNGDAMGGPATKPINALNPGEEVDLEVALTAPSTAGTYRGYWRIITNANVFIPIVSGYLGKSFYVDIKVQGTPTATNTSVPAFTVTTVTYVLGTWNDATHTNCPRVTANITTNAAGTITYEWKYSGGTNPSQSLTFTSAGTQSINYDWARAASNNGTPASVGIFISSPNNKDFGKLDFTIACTTP